MLTGNKGEWSEIYALLKIVADKKLYAGDENLNKIENLVFPIIKILRDESDGTYCFSFDSNLVVINGVNEVFHIPINDFQDKATILLREIKNANASSFNISDIEEFLNRFNCHSLKAKSTVKSDIRIVIHDFRTGAQPELGFSIKSQLGGASTLLNAGRSTNFIYKIEDIELSDEQINEINSINTKSKIKDRIESIIRKKGKIKFVKTENTTFGNNLTLIDSSLSIILSEIVYLFYTSHYSLLVELINQVSRLNPLHYDLSGSHPFYEYKIKRFLTEIALGMMPSKVWTGELDATGGYLVVKESGEVLCYHIYNRNEFENYLINNTKLETASSKRHEFGIIYKDVNDYFIKLNLQIRFIK
ncbi:MAG: HpaII family restriction endonuclease [Tenuifilum sp.]|uniref:HpaII family restriction endonuclease n=1 Tax=Tenuifilum sp. TaxID=2760880 RepID=UPI0030AE8E7F